MYSYKQYTSELNLFQWTICCKRLQLFNVVAVSALDLINVNFMYNSLKVQHLSQILQYVLNTVSCKYTNK